MRSKDAISWSDCWIVGSMSDHYTKNFVNFESAEAQSTYRMYTTTGYPLGVAPIHSHHILLVYLSTTMSAAPKYSVFNSSLHGFGVQAVAHLATGDVALQEKPLYFLQTIPNRKLVIVCGSCSKPLGNLATQVGTLQGTIYRGNMVAELGGLGPECTVVGCPTNCGELYCSDRCRDLHWATQGHRLLCTGHIPDEGAEFHPLVGFKMHAMATNEIFLMVAEVFASMVCQVDNLVAGGLNPAQAFDVAAKPLSGYVRELWWDAALTPKGYKPVAFKKSLKVLVKDTWALLDEVFNLTAKGYSAYLSEDYLSR
jgi:hypothetical protein